MNSTTAVYQKTHSPFTQQSEQVDHISSPTELQSNFSLPMDSVGQSNANQLIVPTSRPLLSPNETRILYHVDDEKTPYLVKLPVSPNSIILNDLKSVLKQPRPNYTFYFKSYEMDCVVKEEIMDDNAKLPLFQGRVVAWLKTNEDSTISDSANSQCSTEILAADRLKRTVSNGTNTANERLGLVGASRPPSFHGSSTDQMGDTTTETESMISSRRGGQYLNHRHRGNNYKSGHHGYNGGKYGNRYQQSQHSHHQHYMDSSVMTSDMESTSYVDSEDDDDDTEYLQNGGEDDDYEDYNSTTTEETSVSRQYARKSRVRRRYKNYPNRNQNMSRTSSLSSITESSMSLNAIQVTLNLDQASFLGISLVGQTSKKGDGGIYVSSIMKGGAVDLEGSIAPGDMILQVNNINFENLTNDEAVQVIREAVKTHGPIKLLVAKCWDPSPKGYFTIPRSEPVRPIDPGAWVAHTEAARAKFTNPDNFPYNPPSISNFTGASSTISSSLPEPGRQIFHHLPQIPISSITSFSNHSNSSYPTSNSGIGDTNTILSASPLRSSFKAGHNVTIAPNPATTIQVPSTLSFESSLESIAYAMASPDSGLDVRDRMWLKIPIPNAFLGSDVVNWLFSCVQGFNERRDAKKFASKLLKAGFIQHTINLKSSFSEKCYFVFSDQLQEINKTQICCNELTQSVGSNFEENFSNSLKLTNENFQQQTGQADFNSQLNHFNTVPNEYSAANTMGTGNMPQTELNQGAKPGMNMMPFMRYWDETSEIHNYGSFGPQSGTAEINTAGITDTASSIHSGGNCAQDSYQSDEISQRSGQSIVFNPQAANHIGMTHSNTMASSGSNGSGNTNASNFKSHVTAQNSSINNNNNANILNHHYEDLQMNPATGNLVPVSGTNGEINSQMFAHNGNHNSNIFQQSYRHIDSEESQSDRRVDSRNEDHGGHYNGFINRADNEGATSTYSGHEGGSMIATNNNIVFDLKARNSTAAASNNKNSSGQSSSVDMNYFNRLSNFQ